MARTADSQPTAGLGVPALVPHGRFKGKPAMPLGRPVTLIGARNRSHLHLVSPTVSKSHAMIVNAGGGFYIRDLASRTHVHVNGERVRETELREGDILGVGAFTFRFTEPAAPARRLVAEAPPAVLRIAGRNLPHTLIGRTTLIGRRPTCDLAVEELDVSTTHAVLFQMSGKWFVRDLGSRTGTHVNGTAVHQQPLEMGDRIRIGDMDMTLVAAAEAGARALDELEDLAGTAPLAADEPVDLIFEEPAVAAAPPPPAARRTPALPPPVPAKPAAPKAPAEPVRPAARQVEQPAARATELSPAPAGNGRAAPPVVPMPPLVPMPPVVPVPPVAPLVPPAAASVAGDTGLELDLAPPGAPAATPAVSTPGAPVGRAPAMPVVAEAEADDDESDFAPVAEVAAPRPPAAAAPASPPAPLDEPAADAAYDSVLDTAPLPHEDVELDLEATAPVAETPEPVTAAAEPAAIEVGRVDEPEVVEEAAPAVAAEPDFGLDFIVEPAAPVAAEAAGMVSPAPPAPQAQPATPPVVEDELQPLDWDEELEPAEISEPSALEAAELPEFAELPEPGAETAGAEATGRAADKSKKKSAWSRIFGRKKDAAAASAEPTAEAPRAISEDLPLVDLDTLAPEAAPPAGLGAMPADAAGIEPPRARQGELAPESKPEAEREWEPDPEPQATAAPVAEAPLDLDDLLDLSADEARAESPAPTAEPVVAAADVEPEVVPEALADEPVDLDLAADDAPFAAAAAEPEAVRAAGDALELEPAPLDRVEVLDRTEPTPESALDLEAVLPEGSAEPELIDEDLPPTAASDESLTDSVFGREVAEFQAAGLGPIVETDTSAGSASWAGDELPPEESARHADAELAADEVAAESEFEPVEAAETEAAEPELEVEVSAPPQVAGDLDEAPAEAVEPELAQPDPAAAAAPVEGDDGLDFAEAAAPPVADERGEPQSATVDEAWSAESARTAERDERPELEFDAQVDPDHTAPVADAPAATIEEPTTADDTAELEPVAESWSPGAAETATESPEVDALDDAPAAPEPERVESPASPIDVDWTPAAAEAPSVAERGETLDGEEVTSGAAPAVEPVAEDFEADVAPEEEPLVSSEEEGMSAGAATIESGSIVSGGFRAEEPATEVMGTPAFGADADAPAAIEEPLELTPAGGETLEFGADAPPVLDARAEDPLVFDATGEAQQGDLRSANVGEAGDAEFERRVEREFDSLAGAAPVPASPTPAESEPLEHWDDGAPSAEEASPPAMGDAPETLESLPPAPASSDMFFGLERDTASFLGGMPLQLPPLRGPFAEPPRVDFRGTAAEAAGGRGGAAPEARRDDDDQAADDGADEPELLLDLDDDGSGVDEVGQGPATTPPRGAASSPPVAPPAAPVPAALAPAEPGKPPRPAAQAPRRGRPGAGPADPFDAPEPAGPGNRMIAGPFDLNLEDAPTDDIEIPPFDGPAGPVAGAGGGGGGGGGARPLTTAFDGLAMPPVRQADVFSQTPLSGVSIPPFAGPAPAAPTPAAATPAAGTPPARDAGRGQGATAGFGADDDDEPLDLDFDELDEPGARAPGAAAPDGPGARGPDDDDDDEEVWEGEATDAPATASDRGRTGGASRRPPAYPAEPAPGARPAPAKKKKKWRIGKWGLFVLMLFCMTGASVGIWFGLPWLVPNKARITADVRFDEQFAKVAESRRKAELDEQRRNIEKPEVRASAREIADKKYKVAPGFLADGGADPAQVKEAARAYTALVDSARLAEKRPVIQLEHASSDPAGDKLRVLALLEALYAANKPDLDKAANRAADYKKAQADLQRAKDRLDDLQPEIDAARQELGGADALADSRRAIEMLQEGERELSAKWDKATARVRALLADVRASETATPPPDPDADPERLPPLPQEDEQVVAMSQELAKLTASLQAQKKQRSGKAAEANKDLQKSLEGFQSAIERARGGLKEDSELGTYLAMADKVQSKLREMSLELQQQQQSEMARLEALKEKLADKTQSRLGRAWAADGELQQLKEELGVAERQLNVAEQSGLREDARAFKKRVSALKLQVAERQDLLVTADGVAPEVKEIEAFIDDTLARMEKDRARNDRRMAEMLKELAADAPAAGSLPAEQKAFAEQLEAQQAELNEARERYAAAMATAGAEDEAEERESEAQLAALQAKIDERKRQVAEATRQTLTAEQQRVRRDTTEAHKRELAKAEQAEKQAEADYSDNRRRLREAMDAMAQVERRQDVLDRLTRRAESQSKDVTVLADQVEGLRKELESVVKPEKPVAEHVSVAGAPEDRRAIYMLGTNLFIVAVFCIPLMVAPDGKGEDGHVPFAGTAAPANGHAGHNGNGQGGDAADATRRRQASDEPISV